MNAPKVSIIIPVYNAEKYLERCIASILEQTFTDYEALFIDDRSADSSREIVSAYQSSDARIRLIELEDNCGSGIARNIGIENARGEYLSFVDSDDTIAPDFLKLLYEKAKETGADIVKGSCVYPSESEGGNEIADTPYTIKARYDGGAKLYTLFIKGHWSAVYRRGFIMANSIRYGETRVSHDVVFLLRAGYFAESFEIAPEARYRYFDIKSSAVHTFSYGRFRASMLAVGEIVDFINENDPYSEELAAFLSSFLMRQLPVHSYLCVQPELKDKADEFIEELRGNIVRYNNLNRLMELNYAVRALIELGEDNNIAPAGMIVGMKNNLPWMLHAFEKLIEHINSERADKAAAVNHLCGSLGNIELSFLREGESVGEEKLDVFYKELHAILLKLNDREAFIKLGGSAAKTMLEYGVNLFCVKASDPIEDSEIRLALLKRTLDLITAHPECSSEQRNRAMRLSDNLLRRFSMQPLSSCERTPRLLFELAEQIKRMNALN